MLECPFLQKVILTPALFLFKDKSQEKDTLERYAGNDLCFFKTVGFDVIETTPVEAKLYICLQMSCSCSRRLDLSITNGRALRTLKVVSQIY